MDKSCLNSQIIFFHYGLIWLGARQVLNPSDNEALLRISFPYDYSPYDECRGGVDEVSNPDQT